jgi:hypothetical protein
MNYFYPAVQWDQFCIALAAFLIVGYIINLQSRYLFTLHVFVRKFSLTDLESPASAMELNTYIQGIFKLPKELSVKSFRALKADLYLGLIFMPLACITLFIFCMKISMKLTFFGHFFFALLAWLQIIPLICSYIQNIYLIRKLHRDAKTSSAPVHRMMQVVEALKWTVLLVAIVFGVTAMCYFWLTGRFHYNSVLYLLIILAEFILIFLMRKLAERRPAVNLADYQDIGN